jgi:flagellar hook-basal body complex protein FliE
VTIDTSAILRMRSTILQSNQALQRAAGVGASDVAAGNTQGVTGFAEAMRSAVSDVNARQAEASRASESYERGETTDIAAVMLARQEASIGFEATLQVRNKLLSAYRDIVSMPV